MNSGLTVSEHFSDGMAAVKQGTKWGYIDKTGRENGGTAI